MQLINHHRFRWVELQLQYLCGLRLPHLVRQRIGKLPKKLSELYQELYDRNLENEEIDRDEREITKRIFMWLLVSQRRLESAELIGLACNANESLETMTRETVLDLCFNLVQYDSQLEHVQILSPVSARVSGGTGRVQANGFS